MTVTAQRILDELGRRNWSGFSADDMIFSSEDSLTARTELNIAIRYLLNLEDFPFRAKEQNILAVANVSEYNMPPGQITSIYNTESREVLTFIGDNKGFDKKATGKPTSYWINYKNPRQKIRLYPIPDDRFDYQVVYNQFKPVMATDYTTKFEFTKEDDFLNLPENLELLFMDCIVLRVMQTGNKDEQDENYRPIIDEFNEAWRVFTSTCKPVHKNTKVIF